MIKLYTLTRNFAISPYFSVIKQSARDCSDLKTVRCPPSWILPKVDFHNFAAQGPIIQCTSIVWSCYSRYIAGVQGRRVIGHMVTAHRSAKINVRTIHRKLGSPNSKAVIQFGPEARK